MTDAASTQGRSFVLLHRDTAFFGLLDRPPPMVGDSLKIEHIENRRRWPKGQIGRQVSWSHHGRVRVVEMPDGRRLAAWLHETEMVRVDA